ncbi:MAG: hypothetical protein J5772_04760 [Clostridia bacterium]|nr:hypothetical protein [Clostridia bacterium]
MNKPFVITIDLAGIPLRCHFSSEESIRFFSAYEAAKGAVPYADVTVPDEAFDYIRKLGYGEDEYAEAGLFTAYASDALLDTGRCIIHAVAVRKGDRAWLISARSGVGKSTQVRVLNELFPGEFSIICGDRPILQLLDDGRVLVHPSPWNGKEAWMGADAAPLEGIICLARGEENRVDPLKPRDAVIPIFDSLIQSGSSEDHIRMAASFENELLSRVPVWKMVNRGVPDSTALLYSTLFK